MALRVMIGSFCVFHMIAVATYAIPTSDDTPVSNVLRRSGSVFRPYVLMTSQWQQWNLFAPEPTRRAVTYHVEARTGETWREIARIEPASLPWWRRERQLTMFGRMLDPAERTYQLVLATRVLQSFCETAGLHEGESLRLTRLIAVMPGQSQRDVEVVRGWTPNYVPSLAATTTCQLNVFQRLDRFFFQPVTTRGFGLLRIAWASTTLVFLLMQWSDIRADFSDGGLLPLQLEQLAGRSSWHFTILDYVTSPSSVFAVYLIFLALLGLSALGLFSRVTTVASVVLLFSFHERNPLLLGGGDTVLRTVGFILAISPSVSAISLDRILARRRQRQPAKHGDETMPIWPVRLLTWQLVVIYGMSVWSKLLGHAWRNGTAIAVALHHPTYSRVSPAVADMLLPVTPLLTFATLIFEAAWLLLLVPRTLIPRRLLDVQLKRLLIIYGVVFHASIFALMDVGTFSVAMIASYCGLLTDDDFPPI